MPRGKGGLWRWLRFAAGTADTFQAQNAGWSWWGGPAPRLLIPTSAGEVRPVVLRGCKAEDTPPGDEMYMRWPEACGAFEYWDGCPILTRGAWGFLWRWLVGEEKEGKKEPAWTPSTWYLSRCAAVYPWFCLLFSFQAAALVLLRITMR